MQSYDIENKNENITFIDETNIYSPFTHYNHHKGKIQVKWFTSHFIWNFHCKYQKNKLVQFARRVIGTGKTPIIRGIQDFFENVKITKN